MATQSRARRALFTVAVVGLLITVVLLGLAGCGLPRSRPVRPGVPVGPQVMVFTASWCGPCQRDKTAVDELERHGYTVVRYDIDRHPTIARQYGVESVPTYIVRHKDREVCRTNTISVVWKLLRGLREINKRVWHGTSQ